MDLVYVDPNGGWGEFKIHGSGESDLIQRSVRMAEINPIKPGHHWFRVVVDVNQEAEPRRGIKLFHIDLNTMRLEVTETWNGIETARMAIELPRTFS
jgi:hypothetical protein